MEKLIWMIALTIIPSITCYHQRSTEYSCMEDKAIKILLPDVNSYWVCKDGIGRIIHCPVGTGYRITTYSCELLTTGSKRTANSHDTSKIDNHPDCPSKDPKYPVLLPHPKDCSKFYMCSNGRAFEKECMKGLHFNPKLKVCDYDENAKCLRREVKAAAPTPRCPKENPSIAVLLPHERDCTSYYICDNGRAIRRKCPDNLYFNPQEKVCDYQERSGCFEETTTAATVPEPDIDTTTETPVVTGKPSSSCPQLDGPFPVFFRHSTNCSVYYMCANGLAYEFVCPFRLHFNLKLNVCDYPYRAGCAADEDNTTTSPKTALTTKSPTVAPTTTSPTVAPTTTSPTVAPTTTSPTAAPTTAAPTAAPTTTSPTTAPTTTSPTAAPTTTSPTAEPTTTSPTAAPTTTSPTAEPTTTSPTTAPTTTSPTVSPTKSPCSKSSEKATLFPHESDCTKYHVCHGDKAVEKKCPDNLHFNNVLKVCDFPENAKCSKRFTFEPGY